MSHVRSCRTYLSHCIQWCVAPGTPPFSGEESSPSGNTQPRSVQGEKQLVGEGVRGEGSGSDLTSFFQRAGRGVSEAVMDTGWQESFNKCRLVGPYVFAWFSSAFTLTWARGHMIQNSTFHQTQYFLAKTLQLLAVWPALDELLSCWQSPWRGKDGTVMMTEHPSQMLLEIPVSALKSGVALAPWLNGSLDELWESSKDLLYKHFSFPLSKLFFQTCLLQLLHLFYL